MQKLHSTRNGVDDFQAKKTRFSHLTFDVLMITFFCLPKWYSTSGRTLLIEQAYELVRMHSTIMPCTQLMKKKHSSNLNSS